MPPIAYLECTRCRAHIAAETPQTVCPRCVDQPAGSLYVRYDFALLRGSNPSDVEKVHIHQTTLGDFVDEDHEHYDRPAETAKDLVTEVLHVRDERES